MSEKKVVVNFAGRLGNQLWILCSAAVLAKTTGRQLHIYNINDDNVVRMLKTGSGGVVLHGKCLFNPRSDTRSSMAVLKETHALGFDDIQSRARAEEKNQVLVLEGYRQHFRYLTEHWAWLEARILGVRTRRQLFMQSPQGSTLPDLSRKIVVHVRRGDYMWNKLINIHTPMSDYYYVHALRQAVAESGLTEAVVFCEPSERQNVSEDLLRLIRVHVPELTSIEMSREEKEARSAWHEMLYMSTACVFVIANSSFSWWAAWLSTAAPDKKRVYQPDVWFGLGMPFGSIRKSACPSPASLFGHWVECPTTYLRTIGKTVVQLCTLGPLYSFQDATVDMYCGALKVGPLARDLSFASPSLSGTEERIILRPKIALINQVDDSFLEPLLSTAPENQGEVVPPFIAAIASSVHELFDLMRAEPDKFKDVFWIAFRRDTRVTTEHLWNDMWFLLQPSRFGITKCDQCSSASYREGDPPVYGRYLFYVHKRALQQKQANGHYVVKQQAFAS